MWWYLGIAAVCAAIVPWSRKRSEGSLTRYTVGTGAPLVFLLLSVASLASAVAHGSGDGDLAREVFTGGLIGAAFAQFILMRRTYGISLGKHPAKGPDGREPDEEPEEARPVSSE